MAGMQDSVLPIAVAHGEGQAEFDSGSSAASLESRGLVTLQYVDNREQPAAKYPFNPNGSALGLAGLGTQAPRIQATQQRCRRAPLRPSLLATRPGTHTTTGDLDPGTALPPEWPGPDLPERQSYRRRANLADATADLPEAHAELSRLRSAEPVR